LARSPGPHPLLGPGMRTGRMRALLPQLRLLSGHPGGARRSYRGSALGAHSFSRLLAIPRGSRLLRSSGPRGGNAPSRRSSARAEHAPVPPAGPRPMIDAQSLTKRFGTKPALQGVSFTVQEGKIHGLLGPNGAGKTTTSRILACLLTADSGD